MKPTDRDGRTYEQKISEAAKMAGYDLTDSEASGVRQRIEFVLMGASADTLSVAQLQSWVGRLVPGMRRVQATLAAHVALAGNEAPRPEHASLFPDSLLRRLAEGADPYQARSDAHEVVCSLVGDRRVRVDPNMLVVTPLRAENKD